MYGLSSNEQKTTVDYESGWAAAESNTGARLVQLPRSSNRKNAITNSQLPL